VFVSRLRKALEAAGFRRLVTRPPGYVLELEPDELDLARFEHLVERARGELAASPESAAETLRQALALWRGPALADFAYEAFAQAPAARLEELRLAALEERIDADLACGRHGELVGELEGLVGQHPLRERLRGQLMLALYRAGRQAEALEAFQDARRELVDELGIDPSPALQRLERSILQQDSSLELAPDQAAAPAAREPARPERSILLAPANEGGLDPLVSLAAPLARSVAPHELILALCVQSDALAAASSLLNDRRATLAGEGVPARVAAFTSPSPAEDLVRLASEQDVDLLLVALEEPAAGALLEPTAAVLAEAPCDVALVSGGGSRAGGDPTASVLVPFGGSDHDWAALELGAWFAAARGAPLRLLGTDATADEGGRDASRLLAHAALAAQQLVGIATVPELAEPGVEGVVRAADSAGLLVMGLGQTWRQSGLGEVRAAVARAAPPPVLLVRRGLRPGGLAPGASLTRFTWSLGARAG
jgi:DNA-binding SARP family transcriptional activator/nucleotide-binding universal stress UspA family protein